MAHSRSALKRWRQSLKRRARNRSVKSQTRTMLGKALTAISNDAASAEDAVRNAISALDRAAQKGVIHANAAARGKSRLLKKYNLAVATSVAAAAGAPKPAEPEAPARKRRSAARKEPSTEKAPRPSRAAAEKKPTTRPRTKKST